MFIVSRTEEYQLNKKIFEIEHTKIFLDKDFFPIKIFLENRGLIFNEPAILEGWDAMFIYKQLRNAKINIAAEELCLFLYMRLNKTQPLFIERKEWL
jgi:hypothetical protein